MARNVPPVRIFTPTDLGLSAVDTGVAATTTGNYVNISGYDTFMLWSEFSSGSCGGHIRFGTKLSDGTTDSGFTPLRGATAYPFVFGGRVLVACGPEGGVFMGLDSTVPTLAGSFSGLEQVRFQLQITTVGAGTANFHLYCKRSPSARMG